MSALPDRINILVLVSGNGSNLQALLEAESAGLLGKGSIVGVISDRAGAYALERAKKAGKPALVEAPRQDLPKEERRLELSNRILGRAREWQVHYLVLAGFLSILRGAILQEYRGRIINLHPSLLPKYGGPGMYGLRVHEAVLAAGETESGCTVHFVDEGTDTGPIILQRRVPVLPGDTPERLAERIHQEEHSALVEAVQRLVKEHP